MSKDSVSGAAGPHEPVPKGSLVVGHDGSDCAGDAVWTAIELASELHAPLVVFRAWSVLTAPRPADWTFGYTSSSDELQAAVLDDLAKDCAAQVAGFPDVAVTYRAAQGGPARCLVELSAGARMLVLGSRGMGGFAEMALGSVSDQCSRHARCPVLVTKGQDQT